MHFGNTFKSLKPLSVNQSIGSTILKYHTNRPTVQPGGSVVKLKKKKNQLQCRRHSFYPCLESGITLCKENGHPLQYSCLGNLLDREAWWAAVHGYTKDLDTNQQVNSSNKCFPQAPDNLTNTWQTLPGRHNTPELFPTRHRIIVHQFSSVQFSHSAMSDSLRPHEWQHTRPPCPSPTPGVHSNSCPSSW